MINTPYSGSAANIPRGIVVANGEQVQGLISFSVDNNNFFQADTFRVVLALSAQPKGRGFDYWALQESLQMELYLGFPSDPNNYGRSDLTRFLLGYVDDIEFDPNGNTVTMAGRDLTSRLIDYKRTITFNTKPLVASDIVTQIAKERGLTPVVTATSVASKSVESGSYYQIVNSLVESNATYWDIITKLAQIEQFQAYVTGNELHFEPRTPKETNPYVIHWQKQNVFGDPVFSNAQRLMFSRNLSIAKDLRVRVLSAGLKTKQTVNEVADRKRVKNKTTSSVSQSTEPPQEYVYNIPNLTPAQAQKRAQAILTTLSQHEMNLRAEMPGDLILKPQNIIEVRGTDTAFDQTYYPSSITRTYSMNEGFVMSITAKNQTPNNPT
ncbi:MAG: hypothetical protein K2Y28_10805 [Burkholderiaceae bacterium]|nr:hypothetical protein [Burkholderiaceae bacterium]